MSPPATRLVCRWNCYRGANVKIEIMRFVSSWRRRVEATHLAKPVVRKAAQSFLSLNAGSAQTRPHGYMSMMAVSYFADSEGSTASRTQPDPVSAFLHRRYS